VQLGILFEFPFPLDRPIDLDRRQLALLRQAGRQDADLAAMEEVQDPVVHTTGFRSQLIDPVAQVIGQRPPQLVPEFREALDGRYALGIHLLVAPAKDVDGLHPLNMGRLLLGEPLHVPATPLGIMALLAEYDVELRGKNAVVIGRSEIVGKPVAMLLLAEHATVTICHSRTADLAAHTREADVLVAAVGRPGLVTPEMVKPGAAVVDVGVNRTDKGLVGDVDPAVAEVAGFLSPVPGGVGPMTIAMLLRNTLTAAQHRRSGVALPGS